MPEYLFFV